MLATPRSMRFNQNQEMVAVGLENGFRIFNVNPLSEVLRQDFEDGGVAIVEMLYRFNYVALVGGGKSPKWSPNKVIIWDDALQQMVIEIEFRKQVVAVRLSRDRIVCALESKIFVYTFEAVPELVATFETAVNPTGTIALCSSMSAPTRLLAFANSTPGHVQLVDLHDVRKSAVIRAHKGKIACLELNADASLLATASETGTLIRVFNTTTRKMIHEFRRGTDNAMIQCIAFSPSAPWLAVTSDKATVHVYSMHAADDRPAGEDKGGASAGRSSHLGTNKTSSLSYFKDWLPVVGSVWSLAQIHLGDVHSQAIRGCACAFGPEAHSVVVVCDDGAFHKVFFDPINGGEGRRDLFANLLAAGDDDDDGGGGGGF